MAKEVKWGAGHGSVGRVLASTTLLSTYYMPGIVVSTRYTATNKKAKGQSPQKNPKTKHEEQNSDPWHPHKSWASWQSDSGTPALVELRVKDLKRHPSSLEITGQLV